MCLQSRYACGCPSQTPTYYLCPPAALRGAPCTPIPLRNLVYHEETSCPEHTSPPPPAPPRSSLTSTSTGTILGGRAPFPARVHVFPDDVPARAGPPIRRVERAQPVRNLETEAERLRNVPRRRVERVQNVRNLETELEHLRTARRRGAARQEDAAAQTAFRQIDEYRYLATLARAGVADPFYRPSRADLVDDLLGGPRIVGRLVEERVPRERPRGPAGLTAGTTAEEVDRQGFSGIAARAAAAEEFSRQARALTDDVFGRAQISERLAEETVSRERPARRVRALAPAPVRAPVQAATRRRVPRMSEPDEGIRREETDVTPQEAIRLVRLLMDARDRGEQLRLQPGDNGERREP